jgi:hypothetical protein
MPDIEPDITAAASTLGWKPDEWPETFTTDDHQWVRREDIITKHGHMLCANYEDANKPGYWLIVYNY